MCYNAHMTNIESSYVIDKLSILYPDAKCELDFNSDFQLLVAVCLSSQCTDKRVNIVTKNLFARYPDVSALSKAKIQDIEEIIKSCGLYHNKAKNLISASKQIVEKYNGQIPKDVELLQKLPGVGRKTANVIVSVAYNIPAIAVDTHVFRVSNRLEIAVSKNTRQCEKKLEEKFEKNDWRKLHHMLVLFGRYLCTSKSPKCDKCPFVEVCPHKQKMDSNGGN